MEADPSARTECPDLRWFAAASTGIEQHGEPAGEPNALATRCTEVHSIEPMTPATGLSRTTINVGGCPGVHDAQGVT